jgi:hypothetical protein
MSSSLIKFLALMLLAIILGGCIADNAEESDLPWSSNKSWEGLAPIAPSMMDRYQE